jgi:hypothetical protein
VEWNLRASRTLPERLSGKGAMWENAQELVFSTRIDIRVAVLEGVGELLST